MPISNQQRELVLELLSEGVAPGEIASKLGVSVRQIAAVRAHATMGTYAHRTPNRPADAAPEVEAQEAWEPTSNNHAVLIGQDSVTDQQIFWDPRPNHSANPHILIIGESGYGKTYAVQCILSDLAIQHVPSIVFDYGQGFRLEGAPYRLLGVETVRAIDAVRSGIAINPLQIFPSDVLGPVHVAQRIADTFCRVYPRLGIQQHAMLRRAVLETFSRVGIQSESPDTWTKPLPPFAALQQVLVELTRDEDSSTRTLASKLESHVSSIFFFRTFRDTGLPLRWDELFGRKNAITILSLSGLEHSLEKAVTELLLWNLLGYVESAGPGALRCFVVLDEAHRLPFDGKSPVERLLREGRKFGVGLILASQQPGDFSEVAFANTATKLIFQISDPGARIGQLITSKAPTGIGAKQLSDAVSRLPRGSALFLTRNNQRFVHVTSIEQRQRRKRTNP